MAHPGLKAFISFAKDEIRSFNETRIEKAIKKGATQSEILDIRAASEPEFQAKWCLLQDFKRLDPAYTPTHYVYDPMEERYDLGYLCYLVGHCYPWEWFSQEYLRLMDGIDHAMKRPTQVPSVQRRVSPRLTEKKRRVSPRLTEKKLKRGITSQTNDY